MFHISCLASGGRVRTFDVDSVFSELLLWLCSSCLCCMNYGNPRTQTATAVGQVRRTLCSAVPKAVESPIECHSQFRNPSFITRLFHVVIVIPTSKEYDGFVRGKGGIKLVCVWNTG